jgi:hypothetical protein
MHVTVKLLSLCLFQCMVDGCVLLVPSSPPPLVLGVYRVQWFAALLWDLFVATPDVEVNKPLEAFEDVPLNLKKTTSVCKSAMCIAGAWIWGGPQLAVHLQSLSVCTLVNVPIGPLSPSDAGLRRPSCAATHLRERVTRHAVRPVAAGFGL